MKVLFETDVLQAALSRVDRGVGSGKMLPITKYIEIIVEDDVVMFISTDLNIWVTAISKPVEVMETGSTVVLAHKFKQLIDNTTKKEVQLIKKDNSLLVDGNGKYNIEIIEEEFPNYSLDDIKNSFEVETEALLKNITINKSSIDDEMFRPCLGGYRIQNNIVTTNSKKMCYNRNTIIDKDMEPLLIGQELISKLDMLQGEVEIDVGNDGSILFSDNYCMIYGPLHDGLSDYPDIEKFVKNIDLPYKVKINALKLNQILNRLSIFKNTISTDGVILEFKKNFILLSNLQGNNKEFLNYTKKVNLKEDFKISLNIDYLSDILTSVPEEVVELHYGNKDMIMISSDKVDYVLAALEETEDE